MTVVFLEQAMIHSLLLMSVCTTLVTAPADTPYDPTDPSQVAEAEAVPGRSTPGLGGPGIGEEDLQSRQGGGGMMQDMPMSGVSVEAILESQCAQCHGPNKQKAGVQLVPIEAMFTGAKQDWVVVPGNVTQSSLLDRIKLPKGHDDIMPPQGNPLSSEQVQLIESWIKGGATAETARQNSGGQAANAASGGRRGRGARSVPIRFWMRTYLELDLTPEQRSKASQMALKLQRESEGFRNTYGQRMKILQDKIRSFQDRSNPTDELLKLREEFQAIQAKQPSTEAAREELWNQLEPGQQEVMRAELSKGRAPRENGRDSRRSRRPRGAETNTDEASSMDEAARDRIRFLLEQRRKAREDQPKNDG